MTNGRLDMALWVDAPDGRRAADDPAGAEA